MIPAKITFGCCREEVSGDAEFAVHGYLAALVQAGQTCGEIQLPWDPEWCCAHVLLAGATALSPRHTSPAGKRFLKVIRRTFGHDPVWEFEAGTRRERPAPWRRAPFFYLTADALEAQPPLRRGDDGRPIPGYTLPLDFGAKEALVTWQKCYRSHDMLWLHSGDLERAAYRQLVDPDSGLSQQGREVGRSIEVATGVPTYYYLDRCWALSRGEERRRCPGCGSDWHRERSADAETRFHHFDFQCAPCRLVSHQGAVVDNRLARIGSGRSRRIPRSTP